MAYGTINAEQLTTQSGFTLGAGNASSFKNRILNGSMVLDQRNAGASTAFTTAWKYYLDRWQGRLMSGTGSPTISQSSTVPEGFTSSLFITNGTGAAPAAGDTNTIQQVIEGFNTADLGWGTANAKSVTLSFWVRSSLTGTFGGALTNTSTRSYPFTYTISTANTWEYKTVTIAGDTSGTWLTTNGIGIQVYFDLGSGTTYQGTAGAWAGADYRAATGGTKIVSTTGATFYITGVQLEVGTVATSFDYRSYGTELALCQRYYYRRNYVSGAYVATLQAYSTAAIFGKVIDLPVTMRTTPTTNLSLIGHFAPNSAVGSGSTAFTSGTFVTGTSVDQLSTGGFGGSSGLVAGNASVMVANTTAWIDASAEL